MASDEAIAFAVSERRKHQIVAMTSEALELKARIAALEAENARMRAENARMREATIDAAASLAAAISLLERTAAAKKAAPSYRMFNQRLTDYLASLESARAALR